MTDPKKPIVTAVELPKGDKDMAAWLRTQVSENRRFLLAYADDGIIWGRWTGNGFQTSHDIDPAISPPLRDITLQQAFVFDEDDEIRLFRDELGVWKSCRIVEPEDTSDVIVEMQMLWGDEAKPVNDYFTRMRDKRKRVADQIIPAKVTDAHIADKRLPRLQVHHFVAYDKDSGEARIALSRFVAVGPCADGEEIVENVNA